MAHPVVHFEVAGKDLGKLQQFYGDLFGWKTQKIEGEMPYALVEKEDGGIAGGIGESPDGTGHVTFYVGTDDPQATLDKAEQLGGRDDPAGDRAPGGHDRDVRRPRGPRRRPREGDVALAPANADRLEHADREQVRDHRAPADAHERKRNAR